MENQENLGEVLFVNETTYTKKLIKEFYKALNKPWVIPLCLLLGGIFVRLLEFLPLMANCLRYGTPLSFRVSVGDWVILSLVIVSFVVQLFIPSILTHRYIRNAKSGHLWQLAHAQYHFADRILCTESDGQCLLDYSQISKVIPTSSGCILVLAHASARIIDKNGFVQGDYSAFLQFLQERCTNLNRKNVAPVIPVRQTPQQTPPAPPTEHDPIYYANTTVITEDMYRSFFKTTNRTRPILMTAYTVIALLSGVCAIGDLCTSIYWKIPLETSFFTFVIVFALLTWSTISLWKRPRKYARTMIENYQTYHGESAEVNHYWFGEQVYFQSKNSHSVFAYTEFTRIVDTDFGCVFVIGSQPAHMVSAKGFIQGSYNDFRQFLFTKCPHLNKTRKS